MRGLRQSTTGPSWQSQRLSNYARIRVMKGVPPMADLVTFVPQADRDAQANLAAFIDLCRTRLTVFGQSLDFEADSWDVSDTIKLAGKSKALRLVFGNIGTGNEPVRVTMREPFKSFAKSYMRYQHGVNPTHDVSTRM